MGQGQDYGSMRLPLLSRRSLLAGSVGTAVAALVARPAGADTARDIQILQTASALELAKTAAYQRIVELDAVSNGNKFLLSFLETTRNQHGEHAAAFRARTTALGGAEQGRPHPGVQEIADEALAGTTSALGAVRLAEQLETIATHTYLENTAQLDDPVARQLMASVMGVESQHAAIHRVMAALLSGGSPELIGLPVNPAQLPAAAGSVATPDAIEPATRAVGLESGAVGVSPDGAEQNA
ncbi:MAG: ferritin-like domain-containing protein [Actinobacteria bacterium]|nr:ferritin-like domain-containing protein [Actinomycetota bacterium]